MPYAHEGDGSNDASGYQPSSFASHSNSGQDTQYPPASAQSCPPQGYDPTFGGYGQTPVASGAYGSDGYNNTANYGGQPGSYAQGQPAPTSGHPYPSAPYMNPVPQAYGAYGQPPSWSQPTHGGGYPMPSGPAPSTTYSYYQSNPQSYWSNGRPTGGLAQAIKDGTRPAGYTGAWPPKDAASAAIAVGALLNNRKQSSAQSGAYGQFSPQGPPGPGSGGSYGPPSSYGGPPTGQGW